jgi:hypothetical protein
LIAKRIHPKSPGNPGLFAFPQILTFRVINTPSGRVSFFFQIVVLFKEKKAFKFLKIGG